MAWDYAAVKWTNTKDTVTVTMLKSCSRKHGVGPVKKSWKNWCPGCKRSGTMVGHKPPKKNLTKWKGKNAPEGEITCKVCGFDACGVCGYEKISGSKKQLKPASSVNKKNASTSSVQSAKCELSKAKALTKAKKTLNANSKSEFKATLTSPMLKNLAPNQKCELNRDVFKNLRQSQFFTGDVKVDISKQTMQIELLEYMKKPSNEYKEPSNSNTKSSATSVNNDVGVKASSAIEKEIMLKGKELYAKGGFNAIWNFIRTGGTGGFKYKYYFNHWKNQGNATKKDTTAMKTCWKRKEANCTDFGWIFYTLGLGAGISIEMWNGDAYFPYMGKRIGHLWNQYKGKIYDASSKTARSYSGRKIR